MIFPLSTANAVRPLSFDHRIANHPNFLKHTHVLSFSCSCPIIPPRRFPPLDIMPAPVSLLDPAEHPVQPLLISGSSIGSTSKSPKPSAGLTPEVSALLPHFASPGIPPPSARVDPTLKIGHPGPPIRLWDIWKYGWLAAGKGAPVRTVHVPVIHGICISSLCLPGLELAVDVLSHHVYGPRRKTWGIEMTIVNSLARDASSHSHLFDIVSRSMAAPIHSENQLHSSEIYAWLNEPQRSCANSFRRAGHPRHL